MTTLDRNAILEKLKTFIIKECLGGEGADIKPDTPLLKLGIMNSMTTLLLVNFMTENMGIKFELGEIPPETYENLNNLVEFVVKNQS